MQEQPKRSPDWEHWPGRRQPDDGLRHRLRALFTPTDQDAELEALIAARGRELEQRVEQLADTIADVERREEQARRLRIAVEEMLRHGSAELDDRHAELTELADQLRERDARLAESEAEVEARRRELGAVELHRAAVERRETAAAEREAAYEQAAAALREREHVLAGAEQRVQALLERQAQLEQREAELVEQAAQLEAREAEVREQAAQLDARGTELAESVARNDDREADLASQATRLEGLATEVERREDGVSTRSSSLDELSQELQRKSLQLGELESTLRRELAEAEAARLSLAAATEALAAREARVEGLEARERAVVEQADRLAEGRAQLDRERESVRSGRQELARAVTAVTSGLGLPQAASQPATENEHLLFVPGDRYRLVASDGPAPAQGETVSVDGRAHTVVRLSPSPLPGDPRRCAILEAAPGPPAGPAE